MNVTIILLPLRKAYQRAAAIRRHADGGERPQTAKPLPPPLISADAIRDHIAERNNALCIYII